MIFHSQRLMFVVLLSGLLASSGGAQAPKKPKSVAEKLAEEGDKYPGGIVPGHVVADPNEPLAKEFSLTKAARSMDLAALNWQMQPRQQCSQCHANMLHLVARPALSKLVPETPDVRELFQTHIVSQRWEMHDLLYAVESVVVAVPLAWHDRQTTGKLHSVTRKALDRMLAAQGTDGTWGNTDGGKSAFFLRTEQTLFAAIGIAVAPDGYLDTPAAKVGIEKALRHVADNPPKTLYARGMQAWAAAHLPDVMTDTDKQKFVEELRKRQRTDGGWVLRELLADNSAVPSGKFAAELPSDGYGTGFAVFVMRQVAVPVDDDAIKRGVHWLKHNQRESGRWFHPTLSTRPNHVLSNTATAWAVLALQAAGEI